MGILSSKIDNRLLEDCKKHIRQIDGMATSLATSVDEVHEKTLLFLRRFSKLEYGGGRNQNMGAESLLKNLLEIVEKHSYVQKLALLNELSLFARFLTSKSDTNTPNILKNLSIDTYLKEFEDKQFSSTLIPGETNNPYHSQFPEVAGSTAKGEDNGNRSEGVISSHNLRPNKIIGLLKELSEKQHELEKEVSSQDESFEELTSKKDQLDKKCRELLEEKERWNKEKEYELKQLKTKLQLAESDRTRLAKDNTGLKQDNSMLKKKVDELQEALSPHIETISVQVLYQRHNDLMIMIEQELTRLLNEQLKDRNIQLQLIRRENPDEIQSMQPLLILCLHASRLGTDANNYIQGIKDCGKTALLIFHHKDKHALPSQSSGGILTGTMFRKLAGIFDLGFLKDKGIYECPMNDSAAKGIGDFIEKSVANN